MKSAMKNSTTMMKRLLNLKEDYTLDLNESDESSTKPVEVEKPLNGDVGGWVQVWKNTIETFTKNLFIQTLQQWLEYKQGTAIQQETIDGIELLAKEYDAVEQAAELLKSKTNTENSGSENNNSENKSQGATSLKESENGGENQSQETTNSSPENNTNQPSENNTNQTQGNENQPSSNTENQNKDGEEISDAEAMSEVLKNLPVLVQDNITSLVGGIEGVKTEDIPKNEPQSEITDLEVLKNYLTKLTDNQDLQNAFSVFENRIKDIQPKPVDEEKLTQVKDHFKIKDDYLDEIEKSWKNYMKAVNNNSEASMLLEMKNLLNAVHNFNKNGKSTPAPTQEEKPAVEEKQESQPENNSEGSQE